MFSMDVKLRALADYLSSFAFGENHKRRLREGYAATMRYLLALRASTKCFTFGSHPTTRFMLSMHNRQEVHSAIEVVTEARDFGGHIATKATLVSPMLTQRLSKTYNLACRLAVLS